MAALLGGVQDDDEGGDPVAAGRPAAFLAALWSASPLQEVLAGLEDGHALDTALAVVVVGLVLLPLLVPQHVHALAKLVGNACGDSCGWASEWDDTWEDTWEADVRSAPRPRNNAPTSRWIRSSIMRMKSSWGGHMPKDVLVLLVLSCPFSTTTSLRCRSAFATVIRCCVSRSVIKAGKWTRRGSWRLMTLALGCLIA